MPGEKRAGGKLTEYLLHVDFHRVGSKAVVTEDHAQRLKSGQLLHEFFRDVPVEAGDKRVFVHKVHGSAQPLFPADGQGEVHAPVQQHLKEQIFGGTVVLDAVHRFHERFLRHGVGSVEHVVHVGRIHLQHAEAGIEVLHGRGGLFQQTALSGGGALLLCGKLFLNLFTCATYALLAYLRNGGKARFGRLALFVARFRQLHHDETTISPVFRVELHHRMGRGRGTREEIEDNVFRITVY